MILYRPGVRPGMCCVMNPCAELCISVRGTAHLQKGLYIFLQILVLERCASIQCTVIHICKVYLDLSTLDSPRPEVREQGGRCWDRSGRGVGRCSGGGRAGVTVSGVWSAAVVLERRVEAVIDCTTAAVVVGHHSPMSRGLTHRCDVPENRVAHKKGTQSRSDNSLRYSRYTYTRPSFDTN
jgi:hypothetical protein